MVESRSTEANEKEVTVKLVNKLRYIPLSRLSHKSTKIEKPKEIYIRKDNSGLSSMNGNG